jgi:putative tryptophan/tyrosine transport system substrate-binding protein
MRRRDFITILSGAAAWPLAARAQQPAMPVVGFLHTGTPEASTATIAGFRKGLSETGYVEGRNLAIEFRWARNDRDRLPELAADLVGRGVAVIAAPGNTSAALAAKAATTTIPIIYSGAADPVEIGLVASLNRPGGNVTGFTTMQADLAAKRIELLHELLPRAAHIALLVNPTNPGAELAIRDTQKAGLAIGQQIEVLAASTNREIDAAFASLVQGQADALLLAPETLFNTRRAQILTLAAYNRLPAMYTTRDDAEAGGLISYGPSGRDSYRQVGIYTGRILKGEKPADLPIVRSTKFELVINLQTARTLGLDVPPTLLALADEVIE